MGKALATKSAAPAPFKSLEERTKCANEELAVILQNYKLNLGGVAEIDDNGAIKAKVVWYDAIDATQKA